MKKSELAWAAGFVDGEGCFSIHKSKTKSRIWRFSLSIAQSDPRPLQRIAAIAGHGNVNGPYNFASNKLATKATYRWCLFGPKAYEFFLLIEPYMCEPKKEQARSMMRQIKVDNEQRRLI